MPGAGCRVPGARVPGARVPGCRVPGCRVPGCRMPGCRTNWPKKRKGLISLGSLRERIGLTDLIGLIELVIDHQIFK